jgi:hypothetical protein
VLLINKKNKKKWLENGWKMVGKWLENGWKMVGKLLTKEEIMDIDDRVTSCSFDNPDSVDSQYYIKVWFNYKNGHKIFQGRREFVALTKNAIIDDVKSFFRNKNRGFEIVFND